MTCGIYWILNLVTAKYYIGQSVDIDYRFWSHQWNLERNSHDNPHLQKVWDKYGPDAFVFELIDECSADELNEVEQWYLTQHWDSLYNINPNAAKPPGMIGRKMPASAIATIRQKAIERAPEMSRSMKDRGQRPPDQKGTKKSKEYGEKRSRAFARRRELGLENTISDEIRQASSDRMRELRQGRTYDEIYGSERAEEERQKRLKSPETRQKISKGISNARAGVDDTYLERMSVFPIERQPVLTRTQRAALESE